MLVIIDNVKNRDSNSLYQPSMLSQRQPIKLGSLKRGNVDQQLRQLTRRHQFWQTLQKKCKMKQSSIQYINIFKGLLLSLERISDLLLYQCFCFSKISICAQNMVEEIERYLWTEAKEFNITPMVAMLKKYIGRSRQPSQDQKEYDQYCLQLETKDQADKAYPLLKFDYDIYSSLMLVTGKRALGHIYVSKSHQEKVNQLAQDLEKNLPQVKQSKQQQQKVSKLFGLLTTYAVPIYAEYYEKEWMFLRRSILAYQCMVKEQQALHKNETSRPS